MGGDDVTFMWQRSHGVLVEFGNGVHVLSPSVLLDYWPLLDYFLDECLVKIEENDN